MNKYTNINIDNITTEHLCCAIGDKKHAEGVLRKKEWMKQKLNEGHVFRKLDAQGKVFIEYEPLEKAWVPIIGDDFLYINCLWVAGSFKGNGYAKELLTYAIDDAKKQNKKGLCIVSSKKKKPFLGEKDFFIHYGFKVVDEINDYQLLALCFTDQTPTFTKKCHDMKIDNNQIVIYYNYECPYTYHSIEEIKKYTTENNIPINLIEVDSLEKGKDLPCIFNNWAVFINGVFISNTILNENSFKKLIEK